MSAARRLRALGLGVTLAIVLLAGCSTTQPDDAETAVPEVGETLPTATVDELLLPFAFHELPTYALPFDTPPQELDGVILGLQEVAGELQFTAVSTDGTVLWTLTRPATCSGYTLTMADGMALAILTDVESSDSALSQTTASAYDLHTGAEVWGPVEVPGPWQGPGTVFAEAAPSSAMGETGERVLLDPGTGEPIATSEEIIGEFAGVLLTSDGVTITASGAASWQLSLTDLDGDPGAGVRALPGVEPPPGFALLSVNDSASGHLVKMSDGQIIAKDVTSAVWDPAAQMLIAAEPEFLSAHGESGQVWKRPIREDLSLAASGGVLTYLRSDTAVQVINAVTGEDAVGYSPDATRYAVPFLITADGAGVFSLDGFTLAGTHPGL